MKPELSRLTTAARLEAETNGRRSAQAAFDRVSAHGYGTADPTFRELGVTLLTKWAREGGLSDAVREVWLASALARFDALIIGRGRESMTTAAMADPFGQLRDTVSGTIRKLGFTVAPPRLSPKHWQHVLALVEARARTCGLALPDGWREKLSAQFGRENHDEPRS